MKITDANTNTSPEFSQISSILKSPKKLYIAIAEKRDEIIEQNEGAAAIVNTISGAVTETSTVNQA